MRDSVVFYRSFWEGIEDLPPEDFKLAVTALMQYALNGTEPEVSGVARTFFKMAKPQVDANNKRYKNGKKGGRPENQTEVPSDFSNADKESDYQNAEVKNQNKEINNQNVEVKNQNRKTDNQNANFKNQTKLKPDFPKPKENEKENVNVKEKETESPPISPIGRLDEFLNAYPKDCNRHLTEREYAALLLTGAVTEDGLVKCAQNYAESCRILRTREEYIKNAENFLRDFVFERYLPGKYKKPAPQKPKNAFQNFEQSNTNYDDLMRKKMLARLQGGGSG